MKNLKRLKPTQSGSLLWLRDSEWAEPHFRYHLTSPSEGFGWYRMQSYKSDQATRRLPVKFAQMLALHAYPEWPNWNKP